MLTKVQKKRLAREARKLAMECVNGPPPVLGTWPECAVGLAARRADVMPDHDYFPSLARHAHAEMWLVADENDAHHGPDMNAAVVFPLLALADALEESSERPPAGPQP